MLILFDFKCEDCGHEHEELVKSAVTDLDCPKCGGRSARKISTPRVALDGTDPGFPDAYEKWGRMHSKEGSKPSESEPDGWKATDTLRI